MRDAGTSTEATPSATARSVSSMVTAAEKLTWPESPFKSNDHWPRISHGPTTLFDIVAGVKSLSMPLKCLGGGAWASTPVLMANMTTTKTRTASEKFLVFIGNLQVI